MSIDRNDKRNFPPILLLVFASGLIFFFFVGCKGTPVESEEKIILVEVSKAEASEKTVSRRFSGFSYPWEAHGVGFLVAGRVTDIKVREGQLVEKDSLLATLDPEDYLLYEKLAKVQVNALAPNFDRVNKLVKKDALPESELDPIQGQYDAALTQQQQAKRQVNYTRLKAPITGVVHELSTSVGQVIGQGMPAVVLLDIDRLKVKFGITQGDLKYFKVGDELPVDFPDVASGIRGKVWHVDYVADPHTRTYDVIVEVENKEHKLRPSMLGHVTIVKEKCRGYFLPISAISRDLEGKHYVMIVESPNDEVLVKEVTIGKRYEETLEIASGLNGGERVIISGNDYAKEGDRVVVK